MDIKDPGVIIRLHDELIAEFGGKKGLISKHLLFSSILRPFSGLSNGTELYPSNRRQGGCFDSFVNQKSSFCGWQ
jgi:hypothetical protein